MTIRDDEGHLACLNGKPLPSLCHRALHEAHDAEPTAPAPPEAAGWQPGPSGLPGDRLAANRPRRPGHVPVRPPAHQGHRAGRRWQPVTPDLREWCEEDDGGPRKCCGTRQLGPHRVDCPKPASFQDGMRDHEEMYRHAMEVER